jgi:NTE family protein
MPNLHAAAFLAGVLGMAATFAVRAQAPACGTREPGDTRPRIGLALGGGGARGIAHVSVLREIEAQHVPIDCIAGTSMGALVGGLYASGMSVDAMEHLVGSTDWKRLFDDSIPRAERSYRRKQDDRDALATVGIGVGGPRGFKVSPGVLQGERILAMFERNTLAASGIERFDDLPIAFRAVATDLNTGEAVVLDHGSLPMAMRASMSLPGVFQPVEIGGRVLIDGGVANQVPVDVLRAMGADIVVAVDVGTPLDTLDRDASLLQVVSQISGMLTTGNTRRMLATLGERDVLIVPPLGSEVGTGDFDKAALALEIGRRAAVEARPRLATLSVHEADYRVALERRPKTADAPPVVDFVRLDNETAYADELLLSRLDITVGEPLDAERLGDRVLGVYGFGTLASITYEVAREGDRTGVIVHARPKAQGPNYLQLGVTVSNDFEGGHDSNLRAGVLFSPLSPFGAEARVVVQIGSEPGLSAQYYHPFDVGNRNLFFTEAAYENPNIRIYDDAGNNVATYDVRSVGLEMRLAREFGNYGAAGVGVERATGRARVQTGDPALPPIDFDSGRMFAFANIDRLDSLFFPRNGYSGLLAYTIARDWLGSDTDYAQVDFEVLGAKSFGRSAVQGGMTWHVTTQGELPLQDRYRIGGRGRLAGFRANELTGQHYAIVFVGYTWQLAEVFGRSAMIGTTLEYGNAWENRSDMAWADGIFNGSVYAGFDSWVGPMLFGYGWREGGEGVLFLEIGKPF